MDENNADAPLIRLIATLLTLPILTPSLTMTHYVLARELRGDPVIPVSGTPYNNRYKLSPQQNEELIHVPSMGSFAVARSLSSQLRLDHFELRNLDDGDSFFDQRAPSPSIASSASTHERDISDNDRDASDKDASDKYYSDDKAGSEVGAEEETVQDGVLTGYRLAFVFLSLLLCTFVDPSNEPSADIRCSPLTSPS